VPVITLLLSARLPESGGDEFVVIMPNTNKEISKSIIKRIRDNLEKYKMNNSRELPLSISIGIAVSNNQEEALHDTFKQADDKMYRDKLNNGFIARNQIFQALAHSLGEKDFFNLGHARQIDYLSAKLADLASLNELQKNNLKLLSKMHDIGKVSIDDAILKKEGPLNAEEKLIIRQHSEKGFRIALASSELSTIADLILKHHENWDGSGYPLGLKGSEIPIECRILNLADAYDAMTNDRPYRKAMKTEAALEEIRACAGKQFDPELVDLLINSFREERGEAH